MSPTPSASPRQHRTSRPWAAPRARAQAGRPQGRGRGVGGPRRRSRSPPACPRHVETRRVRPGAHPFCRPRHRRLCIAGPSREHAHLGARIAWPRPPIALLRPRPRPLTVPPTRGNLAGVAPLLAQLGEQRASIGEVSTVRKGDSHEDFAREREREHEARRRTLPAAALARSASLPAPAIARASSPSPLATRKRRWSASQRRLHFACGCSGRFGKARPGVRCFGHGWLRHTLMYSNIPQHMRCRAAHRGHRGGFGGEGRGRVERAIPAPVGWWSSGR